MFISICIPIKNPDHSFYKLLDSLDQQKIDLIFEVILINSGKELKYNLQKYNNFKIKIFEINPNEFGHGRSRNLITKFSQADFYVFMTQDAIPVNDIWLINLVKPFLKDKDIVGSFSKHIAHIGHPNYISFHLNSHFENLMTVPNPRFIADSKRFADDLSYRQSLHFFSNNSSCVRASYFKNNPFPDVEFSEDQVWAMKALENKKMIYFSFDSLIFHSHFFKGIELFKRSVDESRALKKIFNYKILNGITHLAKHFIYVFLIRLKNNRYESNYIAISKINLFSIVFLESLGYWIGSTIPVKSKLLDYLSRDKGIKFGK